MKDVMKEKKMREMRGIEGNDELREGKRLTRVLRGYSDAGWTSDRANEREESGGAASAQG